MTISGGLQSRLRSPNLLIYGEQCLIGECLVSESKDFDELVRGLIFIYDTPYRHSLECRQRAGRLVADLAATDFRAFNLLVKDAEAYVDEQHNIDDSFPFSPNSLEVLADLQGADCKTINRLRGLAWSSRPEICLAARGVLTRLASAVLS